MVAAPWNEGARSGCPRLACRVSRRRLPARRLHENGPWQAIFLLFRVLQANVMNIVMLTNTYAPYVGGVACSVARFRREFVRKGHRVLVVAPSFQDEPDDEVDVVRLPAIQRFNGGDFSVRLPIPGLLRATLDDFAPDVVHAHHPFLLGDTALRIAAMRDIPIAFTHHTMYERLTHYVPGDSPALRRFVIRLATEFANLSDHVIAPSSSIARILRRRGVETPIASIPTGVDDEAFSAGDGALVRDKLGISGDAFVVGHVGRLAPEKNLRFLTRAVGEFLVACPEAHFLIVGAGPCMSEMQSIAARMGVGARTHCLGEQCGQALRDAYDAMNVFAFASHSETQGMVLMEAMAAGCPVVAVAAPGARDVVVDGVNGRLLARDDAAAACEALAQYASEHSQGMRGAVEAAQQTARKFTISRCASRLLSVYRKMVGRGERRSGHDDGEWASIGRLIGEEWKRLAGLTSAFGEAVFGGAR